MRERPVAVVAGAGSGLGQFLINAFEQNRYNAFGLNRSASPESKKTVITDLTDQGAVSSAFKKIYCATGAPELVIHNAAQLHMAPFADTTPGEFESVWRATVLSAVNVAHEVLPVMVQSGGGTFIVSGATASLRGSAGFSAFAAAKSALRALTQSLAKEYGAKGIHVCHVVLDGILDTPASRERHQLPPEKMISLDSVVNTYLSLAEQSRAGWTFETDLRPMGENF